MKVTTETVEQTQATVPSEPKAPTLEELEANLKEAEANAEAATKELDKVRFDKSADFDTLKAAMGKQDVTSRAVAKVKAEMDKLRSAERMSQLEGLNSEIRDAVREIVTRNMAQLKALEVKGYVVNVTGMDNDTGPEVSARPGVPSAPKSSGGTGTRRSKTTYAGQNARDFITARGPEKWDGARIAKILDDPNNLNHYARTLAKALNITPESA